MADAPRLPSAAEFFGPGLLQDPQIPTANAVQHGGDHYKALAIEPWDYIVANNIPFLEGSAIKYLTRWRAKGGVQDLRKALHFVQKAIEVETQKGTV
nr:DUF3310 domain-containing protein [uncultured Albidiferax sp.]